MVVQRDLQYSGNLWMVSPPEPIKKFECLPMDAVIPYPKGQRFHGHFPFLVLSSYKEEHP